MNQRNTVLLVIDMQEKLINVIPQKERIISNIIKLVEAFEVLECETIYTEQNPSKLGETVKKIKGKINSEPLIKMSFNCCIDTNIKEILNKLKCKNIVIVGIEAHVCILQTALDLINENLNIFILADAIGSRNEIDSEVAIRRLELKGIIPSTTETIIFELCKTANRKEFKEISQIIKRL